MNSFIQAGFTPTMIPVLLVTTMNGTPDRNNSNGHWEEDLQKAFEAGRKMAETKTF